jgi:hypothetical protein
VFSAFFIYYRSQPTGVALAALQSENFQSALGANAAGVRFDALAELFRLGEPQHAIDLFYSLEPQAQLEVLRAVGIRRCRARLARGASSRRHRRRRHA